MSGCPEGPWLALAGGGLHEGHITRMLEELARCADQVLVETYTLTASEWLVDAVRGIAGEKVIEAHRSMLEEGAARLLERAGRGRVLVVVPGDPLIATTHRHLLAEARRRGIRTILVPGISGVCAAKTVTGLDYYKYGRVVTAPGPWRMVKPYSVLEAIYGNMCLGLHTLLLLDIDPVSGSQLEPCRAVSMLRGLEAEIGSDILSRAEIILVERAAMPGERISLLRCPSTSGVAEPASLVIPGRLARYEAEALADLHGVEALGNAGLAAEACGHYRRLSET